MANAAMMQKQGNVDWRSDAAIAYAIFRLTFGVNICFRGIVRIRLIQAGCRRRER